MSGCRAVALSLLVSVAMPGCFYQIGSNLTAGMLDETRGKGKSKGINGTVEGLVERELIAQLGRQLGDGIIKGAFTEDQTKRIETTIDRLLDEAATKGADGVKHKLSPALREAIKEDVIRAASEGLRDDLKPALQDTIDGIVTQAVISLRRGLQDEDTEIALAELLRDATYSAMRENGTRPGVGDTLQRTLDESVLSPFETTMGNVSTVVADKVAEQAQQTRNLMAAILAVVAVVAGVFMTLWMLANRRLAQQEGQVRSTEFNIRQFDAALADLDDETRRKVLEKLSLFRSAQPVVAPGAPPGPARADDYDRGPRS
jgi:hypothetical protein